MTVAVAVAVAAAFAIAVAVAVDVDVAADVAVAAGAVAADVAGSCSLFDRGWNTLLSITRFVWLLIIVVCGLVRLPLSVN